MEQSNTTVRASVRLTELTLSLRNFSYLLGTMIRDPIAVDGRYMADSFHALRRQVDGMADSLCDIRMDCFACGEAHMSSAAECQAFLAIDGLDARMNGQCHCAPGDLVRGDQAETAQIDSDPGL